MATKTLKLTGLRSTTNQKFGGTLVTQGQTARMDSDLADHLLKGNKPSNDPDGEPIPYWIDVSGSPDAPNHDFSTEDVAAVEKDKAAEPAKVDDGAKAPRRSAQRGRP